MILDFICTPAYADAAAPGPMSSLMSFFPFVLVFGVMYFFMIRPQSKKAKAHREMLSALRRGDRVVTSGGILGTVTKIENDQEVDVEISSGVTVRIIRGTIAQVVAKPQPLKDSSSDDHDNQISEVAKLKKPAAKKASPAKKTVSKEKS